MNARLAAAVASVLVMLAMAGGCLPAPTGQLSDGSTLQKTCPKTPLASSMHIDISGTFAIKSLSGEAISALRDLAARTAVCNGHLRVSAFAGTSAQTELLFDSTLSLPGATGNARYRKLDKTVDQVVSATDSAYRRAVKSSGHPGSDIIGNLRVAAEYGHQVAPTAELDVVVLTDGFQTASVRPARAKTTKQAAAFADQLPVPKIHGRLTFAGLGNRSDGPTVSSAAVELLKAFYDRICARTGASPCTAVTNYEPRTGGHS